MHKSRCLLSSAELVFNTKPLVGAMAVALLMCSTTYAATFGHSRIVSAAGQPLRIDVPIQQLSADDLRSITVSPAPAAAWAEAGLTPPVDLDSLQLDLIDGYAAGTKLIQVRSTQSFNKPVADLLLDVRTATGQQRHQVSLLARTAAGAAPVQYGSAPGNAVAGTTGAQAAAAASIRVKHGDYMFDIARRHAVPGVTVYQMMIALQRANPQAFIHNNVNLVKAGKTLTMPDMAALTAISDQEARRIFQKQAQEFALYRQRTAAGTPSVTQEQGSAAAGVVSPAAKDSVPEPATGPQDQLRLSGNDASNAAGTGSSTNAGGSGAASSGASSADTHADDQTAKKKDTQDAQQRVSQLEQNVKSLSEALQSQGAAASSFVLDGKNSLSQSAGDEAPGTKSGADTGQTNAGSTAQGESAASGADSPAGKQGANVSASTAGAATTATPDSGTGAAASGNASALAAGSGDSSNGTSTSNGTNTGPNNGTSTDNGTSSISGTNSTNGADSVNGAGQSPESSSVQTAPLPGQPSLTANGGASSAERANNNASTPSGASDGVAQPISTKAEQTVSWLQEHMLAVITGLLAFIVLVIAWLLRRANTAGDDGRDEQTGLITEAMVKEKLDQINLDLDQQTDGEPPRRS